MDEVKYYPARMDYPNLCKPYTNADRIRQMSDEELAERLALMTTICEFCAKRKNCDDPSGYNQCMEGILDWLQQPAEEADNETVEERKDGDGNG